MRGTRIAGLGHAVPARCVPNAEIEAEHGLPAGWIARRTGIETRHYAAPDDRLSDLAAAAGRIALTKAGEQAPDHAREPGLLLLATSTPDQLLPPSAPLVAAKLGLHCGAVDLAGTCAGFLYALTLADAHCRASGQPVLLIAANILSRRIDRQDIGTHALFADAAGAVLVVPDPDPASGLIAADLESDGSGYDLIGIAPGESTMHMAGREVFHRAVDIQTDAALRVLASSGTNAAAIDRWAPHQANARIVAAVAQRLALPDARLISALAEYGNSSAATIPVALSHTAGMGEDVLTGTTLLTAVGAGMLSAALLWRQD